MAEVLACNLRFCSRIKGLQLPSGSCEVIVSQYADDTSVVCSTNDAILATFDIYDLYGKASGARINTTKSKGLWLGPWRHRVDPPVSLSWSSDSIRLLGTTLGPGNLEEENFLPRLD